MINKVSMNGLACAAASCELLYNITFLLPTAEPECYEACSNRKGRNGQWFNETMYKVGLRRVNNSFFEKNTLPGASNPEEVSAQYRKMVKMM